MGAPRLTDNDIERAVLLLDGWTGKLTWERFLAVLATEIGHHYTKPAMHKHARIIVAWEGARKRLESSQDEVGAARSGDAAVAEAHRRIERLKATVDRVEQENRDLLERFLRWSHNAARLGFSIEVLDAPLPAKGPARPWKKPTGEGKRP